MSSIVSHALSMDEFRVAHSHFTKGTEVEVTIGDGNFLTINTSDGYSGIIRVSRRDIRRMRNFCDYHWHAKGFVRKRMLKRAWRICIKRWKFIIYEPHLHVDLSSMLNSKKWNYEKREPKLNEY